MVVDLSLGFKGNIEAILATLHDLENDIKYLEDKVESLLNRTCHLLDKVIADSGKNTVLMALCYGCCI